MRPFPAAVLSEPRQGGMHAAETICPFVNQPPHFLSVERVGGRAEIFRKTVANFSWRLEQITLHFSPDSPCHSVFGWLRVRNSKTDLLLDWKWENVFMNLSTILLIVQDIGVTAVIKLLLGGRLMTIDHAGSIPALLLLWLEWSGRLQKKRFNGADSGPPLLKSSFIFFRSNIP